MDPVFFLLLLFYTLLLAYVVPLLRASRKIKTGDYAAAERIYERYYRLLTPFKRSRIGIANNLGVTEMMQFKGTEAELHLEEALEGALASHNKSFGAYASANLAVIRIWQGRLPEADALLDNAAAVRVTRKGWKEMLAARRAQRMLFGGDLEEAEAMFRKLYSAPSPSSDPQATAGLMIAACRFYREDYAGALKRLLETLAYPQVKDELRFSARTMQVSCLVFLGRLEEARELSAQLLSELPRRNSLERRGIQTGAALLAWKQGDWERARYYAEEALHQSDYPFAQAAPMLILAEAFFHYNNPARARALCEQIKQMPVMPYYHRWADRLLTGEVIPAPLRRSSFVVQQPNSEERTQQTYAG